MLPRSAGDQPAWQTRMEEKEEEKGRKKKRKVRDILTFYF
jgi:hypothetical protein